MKKQFFTVIAILAIIFSMASCGDTYKAKAVTLKNQNDSLNYAFGMVNGGMIRQYNQITDDSADKSVAVLMDAFNKSLASKSDKDDKGAMYNVGVQIGSELKQMQKDGFLGMESLTVNLALIKQAFVNSLYGQIGSFDYMAAESYLNGTMQKLMEEKEANQYPEVNE